MTGNPKILCVYVYKILLCKLKRTRGVAYTEAFLDNSPANPSAVSFLSVHFHVQRKKNMGKERKKKTKKSTTAAKKKGIFMSIVEVAIHTSRLNSSRLLKRVRCRDK